MANYKLIRDKLVKPCRDSGLTVTSIDADWLNYYLGHKLQEEALEVSEVISSGAPLLLEDMENLVEELADVLEVIDAIYFQNGISSAEVERVKSKKLKQRGGFREGYIIRN